MTPGLFERMRSLRAKLYFPVILVLLAVSCQKDKTNEPDDPNPPTATLAKFVVDSTVSKFLSNADDIEKGDFKYDVLPGIDSIKKGDFFIEPRDYGYLRVVENVIKSSGQVIIETTQGALSDFYRDSGLIKRRFSMPDDENPFLRTSSPGGRTTVSFPDFEISGNKWSVGLSGLQFSFNPDFICEIDVENNYLKAGIENAKTILEYNASVNVDAIPAAETEFKLSSIYPISRVLKLHIPNLLMQIHVVDFIVKVKIQASANLQQSFRYKNHMVTNAYLEYKDGVLGGVYNTASPVYENSKDISITGGLNLSIEMYPVIRIREFGLPIIHFGVKGIFETDLRHSLVHDTWDLKSQVYGGFFGNFDKTIFKYVLPEEYIITTDEFVLFETPKRLEHISGGDESPAVNAALEDSIEFQVFEEDRLSSPEPEPLVNVFFTSDYGKWAYPKVRTDKDGKVRNAFTMGPEQKEHTLTATIRDAENKVIASKVIKIVPKGPASASVVSGNNQQGTYNNSLSKSLVVLVKDEDGQPMRDIDVAWAVSSGGGQLGNAVTKTSSNGQASNTWKLGPAGTQTVTATIKKFDGTHVTGSPLTFNASAGIDTATLLVSHGVWKAISGVDDDGTVLLEVGSYSNHFPTCNLSETHYNRMDSLHLKFNSNGTGTYNSWSHDWGTKVDIESCSVSSYDTMDPIYVPFTWQYLPAEKKIRITFPVDFWAVPENIPAYFSILSFSESEMRLMIDADPEVDEDWNYIFR